MTDWDFVGTLDIVKNGTNPEIWHVRNNTHPGIGWSIKTVIPKLQFCQNAQKDLVYGWANLCAKHVTMVTWTDAAYDWDGNNLNEWQTMWVRDGFDVIPADTVTAGIKDLKLVTVTKGREPAIESIIDNLRAQLAQSNNVSEQDELTELLEIAEAMLTQTSDSASKTRRKNMKVVDED